MAGGSAPHADPRTRSVGPPVDAADAVVVALHGRGGTARDVLGIVAQLDVEGVAGVAPQATGNTWYPRGFMEPIERNEPWLSAALEAVDSVVRSAADGGVQADRTVLLGFSQGACLATEYAARNVRRYGGLVAFSGGLIGPPGTPRDYDGSFDGTPAFLGCSDADPHIPVERVEETAAVLGDLGADVTTRFYPGMGHTVNADELEAARELVASLTGG